MNPWLVAILAAVVSVPVGWRIQHRLATLDYRLPDEESAPAPTHRWVPAGLPIAVFLLGYALATHHSPLVAVVFCVALPVLVALVAIDADVHRLPDRLTYPFAALTVAIAVVASVLSGQWGALLRAILAGVVLFAVYLVLVLASPGGAGLGLGDVKLAAGLGTLLGWFSWGTVLGATLLTFIIGGVWAMALVVTRRATRHTNIAFGPFMVVGTLVTLCFAGSIT